VDRDTLRTAGLAALGVVAVALTATTLPTARQPEPRGSGGTSAPGSGSGGGLTPRPNDPLPQLLELPYLTELVTVLAVLALVVALGILFVHRRRVFRVAVVLVLVAIIGAAIVRFVPMGAPPTPSGNVSAPMTNASGGGGGTGGTASGPSLVSVVLVVVIGVALVGTAVAAKRRTGDDDAETDDATDSETGGSAVAVGRAAGRAADRIEAATDLDNEVFRAWREMTDHLDVSRPETQTAREFERAAVAAGMTSEDVGALTDLFERARYDDYAVDDDDEAHAVELLRRIEDRYVEDER